MQQKRVNDKLYVLDFNPYEITEDTDVDIIYVQQEKYDEYVELNPSLADKIKTINYLVYTVKKKEWADDEPSPSEKKETGLNFNASYYTFNQGDTGNFTDFIDNPNNLDYLINIIDQNGYTLDQSDNEYITWDGELNYTVQNNFTSGLTILLDRAEDDEWYGVSGVSETIILPNENEQQEQEAAICSTFDEQTDALDIYLTPEILSDMIADNKTSDIIANILNYRYVMEAKYVEDGTLFRGQLWVHYNDDGNIHIGIDDGAFRHIFTITKNGLGGMNSDSIEFYSNTGWVILHKPSNTDFYAVYLDGQSNTRYIKTDKLYEDANDNDLNYNQSFINCPFGMAWNISDNGSYSASFMSSKSNAVQPYIDRYIIAENLNTLPTNEFGIQSVEMVTTDTHSTLTVTYPEGEQWYVALENFVWLHADALSDYVISAGHEVTVFLDGSYDQTTATHVYAVSGINQSDINGNSFTMPNNNVTVNAEFWQATDVDLQVHYGDNEVHHLILAANFGPGTTDAELQVAQYIGYYEVDGSMENQEFTANDVEWSCAVPEITFNLVGDGSHSHWCISCDSSYTPDGSETATVSLVQGLHYVGSKEYTIIGEGS